MRKRLNNISKPFTGKLFREDVTLKTLSCAAFAGAIVFGAPALAQDIQLDESLPQVSLGTSDHIKWEKVDTAGNNTIEINLPDETQYYKYTYTKPENYTESSSLYNNLNETNTQNILFKYGIFNEEDKSSINIIADFIYNQGYNSGGAIANQGAIGNITGDFVANYASYYGGAISNGGTIGNITGDFINNHLDYLDTYGGAISNRGSIGNITGDFINNHSWDNSNAYGGAIYNA